MAPRYALHRVRTKDLEVGDIHAPGIGAVPAEGISEETLTLKARVGSVSEEGTVPDKGKPRFIVGWVNDPIHEGGPEWLGIYEANTQWDVFREIPGSSGVVEMVGMMGDNSLLIEPAGTGMVSVKVQTTSPVFMSVTVIVEAKKLVRTLKTLMPEAFKNGSGK